MTEKWTLTTFLLFRAWLEQTHPELFVAPVLVDGKAGEPPAFHGFAAGYNYAPENPELNPNDFAAQLADQFEAIRFGWCENCYELPACRAMHHSGSLMAGLCHTCFEVA